MTAQPPSPFRASLDAILLACGGWALYCVCDAISKWLVQGYSPFEILIFSCGIGTILSGAWILARHGWRGFLTPKWKWYVPRGIVQAGSSACSITALSTIPLSDFYGIVFLTPMVTTLLAVLFLGERIGLHRICAIIVGFIGVLVIAGPSFSSGNIGYLFACGTTLFGSLSAIMIRKIGHEPVVMRFAFYPFAVGVVAYTPLLLMAGFKVPASGLDLSLLCLYSPVALVGLLGYSSGFSRARDTAVVAPFHYTQMIWGSLFGYFIFHHVPAWTTFAGAVLIIAGGLMVIWREHVQHKQIAMTAAETPI